VHDLDKPGTGRPSHACIAPPLSPDTWSPHVSAGAVGAMVDDSVVRVEAMLADGRELVVDTREAEATGAGERPGYLISSSFSRTA
jgi:hypothetical protein